MVRDKYGKSAHRLDTAHWVFAGVPIEDGSTMKTDVNTDVTTTNTNRQRLRTSAAGCAVLLLVAGSIGTRRLRTQEQLTVAAPSEKWFNLESVLGVVTCTAAGWGCSEEGASPPAVARGLPAPAKAESPTASISKECGKSLQSDCGGAQSVYKNSTFAYQTCAIINPPCKGEDSHLIEQATTGVIQDPACDEKECGRALFKIIREPEAASPAACECMKVPVDWKCDYKTRYDCMITATWTPAFSPSLFAGSGPMRFDRSFCNTIEYQTPEGGSYIAPGGDGSYPRMDSCDALESQAQKCCECGAKYEGASC